MVKPAFLASLTDKGLVILGVLKELMSFFTGLLHNGQCVSGALSIGRLKSKPLRHEGHASSEFSAMYE